MKMGVKFGLAFGAMILLLLILAATGIFELNSVNSGYGVEVETAQVEKAKAMHIEIDMLQVRRGEKDFLSRRDMKYPKRVNKFLDNAERNVSELLQSSDNAKSLNELKGIQTNIKKYRTVFASLVAGWQEKGLDENSGLQGNFRDAAHKLEQVLSEKGVAGSDILYLSLRKHEKDYLLRGDSKYVDRAHKTLAALESKTARSQLSSADKNTVNGLIAGYKKSFDDLVAQDGKIDNLLKEMKQNADQAMASSEKIVELFNEEAELLSHSIQGSAKSAITAIWVVSILSVLIAMTLAYFFAHSITVPMGKTVQMITEMEKGHLGTRLQLTRADEIGQMAAAMDTFAESLQIEVVNNLQKLASGNLTFEITPKDADDEIRGAIQKLGNDLSDIVGQIQVAGEQIATGSGEVSDTSQSLSQGATEQASSLEEISASLNELSSQTTTNADNAGQASSLATNAQTAAENGSQQMQAMVSAMAEINEAGQNISKIIKVIDEIAFQTNLLALNAAVEAARAGQHGKGFAVVAEEVRNLAARSAKAAAETAELIEGSVEKTTNGTTIANQTEEALKEIFAGISKVTDLIGEIAAASNEQAQGVSQINQGVSQIDQVTQQNTAAAEESAAAAEELSGQAEQLRQMLGRFTLKQSQAYQRPQQQQSAPRTPQANIGWVQMEQDNQDTPTQSPKIDLDDNEFGKY